ncbi:hypothetical protein GHT06_005236 [Daphnia sinensis]|uniref:Uncharacterized protein n=1 Tax=Daphnia sinensis TaxID=1820382 RepID=A0AAD5L3V5_9CRUS|nr:hypothetical protein GHT06_005714 [Daphnia sinensis]KAI9550533.1 hypothetical protein GHT06_005236 [Daphnia sinensis]
MFKFISRGRKGAGLMLDYTCLLDNCKGKVIPTIISAVLSSMMMSLTTITLHFLPTDLIKDNFPKLRAKGMKVQPVWDSIATQLQAAGYSFSNKKDAGIKLKIKWNNLLAKRKEYVKLISATGSSADVLKKKPSYYDEIELIIGAYTFLLSKQMKQQFFKFPIWRRQHKGNPILRVEFSSWLRRQKEKT